MTPWCAPDRYCTKAHKAVLLILMSNGLRRQRKFESTQKVAVVAATVLVMPVNVELLSPHRNGREVVRLPIVCVKGMSFGCFVTGLL